MKKLFAILAAVALLSAGIGISTVSAAEAEDEKAVEDKTEQEGYSDSVPLAKRNPLRIDEGEQEEEESEGARLLGFTFTCSSDLPMRVADGMPTAFGEESIAAEVWLSRRDDSAVSVMYSPEQLSRHDHVFTESGMLQWIDENCERKELAFHVSVPTF